MNMKKTIYLFYILYTLYMILVCGSTNLSILYVLPAIVMLWLFFISMIIGYNSYNTKNKLVRNDDVKIIGKKIVNLSCMQYLIISAICLIISVVSAKYYTGNSFTEVIKSLMANESNYYIYQNNLNEINLNVFSFKRVIYPILMGIKNIIFVYSFILLIVKLENVRLKHFLYLSILTISHLYFGLARGTNFEAYQLFVIFVYSYVSRKIMMKKKINLRLIIALGLVLTFVFISVLKMRGAEPGYTITTHIYYDENKLFSSIFKKLTLYYLIPFSYLGFGIYYLSTMINEVWLENTISLFWSIFPFNYGESMIKKVNKLVDLGVQWVPDSAIIMSNIGAFGLILICYLLGLFIKKINSEYGEYSIFSLIFGYIISVFFISMPNGHFLSFSSEKILLIFTLLLYLYKSKLVLKKRKRKRKIF